jgi:hypothetical protein
MDDAVVTAPHAKTRTTWEGFGAGRPWHFTQERNGPPEAIGILGVYALQRPNRGRTQLNP